jgi:SAM-dependent methyltransferase
MPYEPLNFARRAEPSELAEWMDEPCSYEEFRECLIDLAKVNRITLAHRATLQWLDRVLRTAKPQQPLHIVDVGCGGGDLLRAIAAWSKRRKVQVVLTGIDLNPYAARAAREFDVTSTEIHWVTGNALTLSESQDIDIVVSSLFTHHLARTEIVQFLAWMEAFARVGWFINDLYRTRYTYHLFQALARISGWHRFVQHDGPISIRRSFCEQDWQSMRDSAGIDHKGIEIARCFPGRLCVGRIK